MKNFVKAFWNYRHRNKLIYGFVVKTSLLLAAKWYFNLDFYELFVRLVCSGVI